MNIVVNTRLLLENRLEGIGWFTYEVMKRITRENPGHHFFFIFDRPYSEKFIFSDNITPVVAPPQARHPILFYIWFEKVIPELLKRFRANVFISPDGYLSLSTPVKSIPVIHDINFTHRPKDLPWLINKYYNYYFPRFAQKAARIATVSNYSKNDICTSYNINEQKVEVIYNGVSEKFNPIHKSSNVEIKNRFTGGEDYFLYVGSLHKRKNIINLLKSFDLYKKQTSSKIKLLLVGEKMFNQKELGKTLHNISCKNEVVFAGRLSSEDLSKVMACAFALVFIPYFEGFGLPIVEAMASGVPVIASNVTSLPEIAGEAALMCNPESVQEVAQKMKALENDHDLYNGLVKKGLDRSKLFNWDNTATLFWECIDKAL